LQTHHDRGSRTYAVTHLTCTNDPAVTNYSCRTRVADLDEDLGGILAEHRCGACSMCRIMATRAFSPSRSLTALMIAAWSCGRP